MALLRQQLGSTTAHTCSTSSRGPRGRVRVAARWPWSKGSEGGPRTAAPPPPPPPPPLPPQSDDLQEQQAFMQQLQAWQQQQQERRQQGQQYPGQPQQQQQQQPPRRSPQPSRPQQQQQQQRDAAMLQDMMNDLTENPKWRWPSWSDSSPPPPPPPPQQQQQRDSSSWQGGPRQQQQQAAGSDAGSYRWPFIGGAFKPTPPEDIKERLERMGVVFDKEPEQELPERFEDMDDKQVQIYMDRLRQQRLDRITGRQDDEILGIVQLYLTVAAAVIAIAAITSLPW